MKKIILLFVACSSLLSCTAQKKDFSADALNENILSFEGSTSNLQAILNKHVGKAIVIEIWASWCGDCVKAMPKLKELQAKNPNVAYVFISMDKTVGKWKEGILKHELKGDHYMALDGMKGSFGKSIDLDWIPRYIIIDKTGKVEVYRAIESEFDKIQNTLIKLYNK